MSIALAFASALAVMLAAVATAQLTHHPTITEQVNALLAPVAPTARPLVSHRSLRQSIERRLHRAGIHVAPARALSYYLGACAALSLVLALTSHVPWLAVLMGVGLPTAAANVILTRRSERRQRRLDAQVLALLGSLVGLVGVGQRIQVAIAQATLEIGPPLRPELDVLVRQLETDAPLGDALMERAERLANMEFQSLAEAVALFEKSGGNLLGVLERLEAQVAAKQAAREQITSRLAQAKLVRSLMMGFPIVVVLLEMVSNRKEVHDLTTPPGLVALLGAAVFIALGAVVSRLMLSRIERLVER